MFIYIKTIKETAKHKSRYKITYGEKNREWMDV